MATLNLQVGASNGDGRQSGQANDAGRIFTNGGVNVITDSALSPGSHAGNDEWSVGARFTGVTIAQGTTITSATYTMKALATYNAGANVVAFLVSGQAADNAGVFATSSGNLNNTNRPRTTAVSSVWNQTSIVGETDYSIDVTSCVQEIINRAGWASGNALVILVDPNTTNSQDEWQDYYAYDNTPSKAPKLDITYTVGGATSLLPQGPRLPMAILAR